MRPQDTFCFTGKTVDLGIFTGSTPRRVGLPEKPNQSFDVQVLKSYDLTVNVRQGKRR